MKIPLILVPILLASASFSAHAQTFTAYQHATTDSDVYNAGTGATAIAFDFNDQLLSTTTQVNGVTFIGTETNSATGVSFTLTNLPSFVNNGVISSGLASGHTANYAYILNETNYNTPSHGSGTLTFSGLTAGDTYKLQLWGGSTNTNYTETITDGTTVPGPVPPSPSGSLTIGPGSDASGANFITETFTAPATHMEILTISPSSYLALNAINLQDISVPEPTTFALILGGLAVLFLSLRRQASQMSRLVR